MEQIKKLFADAKRWICRAEHKQKADEVRKAFTEHPELAGETYFEHLWFSAKMTVRLLYTAFALLLHGILPFICTHTASNQIDKINAILAARRQMTTKVNDE